MIDKAAEFLESLVRLSDQIFIVDFDVVCGDLSAMFAALSHHPLPVQSCRDKAGRSSPIPRQGRKPAHFFERESNIAPVTNNVHEQRIRDVSFHALNMQHVVGIVNRPPGRALDLSDAIHNRADEISASTTVIQNVGGQLLRVKSRSPKALAPKPGLKNFLSVLSILHRSKPGNQNLVER